MNRTNDAPRHGPPGSLVFSTYSRHVVVVTEEGKEKKKRIIIVLPTSAEVTLQWHSSDKN